MPQRTRYITDLHGMGLQCWHQGTWALFHALLNPWHLEHSPESKPLLGLKCFLYRLLPPALHDSLRPTTSLPALSCLAFLLSVSSQLPCRTGGSLALRE
jgi:hypothetical protein